MSENALSPLTGNSGSSSGFPLIPVICIVVVIISLYLYWWWE